ncbi:hypothetical protein ACR77J_07635 [Tissierella praeacuta]|uniref:hypothetical protein n=1 Tax=Tissierella praeacuta TaxID=43131 RepID=UPI003DA405A1
MNFNELPLDMQEDIKKLAAEHPITINEAMELYLMGGNLFADDLCKLKSVNVPDELIRVINNKKWDEHNRMLWDKLAGKVCNNCRFWTMYIDNGYCDVHDKHCEIDDTCDKYEPNINKAWKDLVETLARKLRLYDILDWMEEKLNKSS